MFALNEIPLPLIIASSPGFGLSVMGNCPMSTIESQDQVQHILMGTTQAIQALAVEPSGCM